jgi:hypothetical protein
MSSLRECVAHVLGAEPADLPDDEQSLREWLAQRGLGLVPVADPAAFSWPGPFLARASASGTVLFAYRRAPVAPLDGAVQAAYVIADHEVRARRPPRWRRRAPSPPSCSRRPQGAAAQRRARARDRRTRAAGRPLRRAHGTFSPDAATGATSRSWQPRCSRRWDSSRSRRGAT